MKTYEFAIIASGLDRNDDDFETRFFEAGCDDATVAFQKGHIILDFAREAESIEEAIASAIENVAAAGATVDRVEPDPLVNLADIAARTNMTRAAMTQYSKGQRGKDFPAPKVRVTTDNPMWDWAVVARWLYKNRKLSREAAIEAEVVSVANLAIENHELNVPQAIREHAREYEDAL
jgi:hypothetical protein